MYALILEYPVYDITLNFLQDMLGRAVYCLKTLYETQKSRVGRDLTASLS